MNKSSQARQSPPRAPFRRRDAVQLSMAMAMLGRAVYLVSRAHKISRGVVTGVFTEAGMPKLMVSGVSYDLSRVLTVLPAPQH
jgi:hypothetical protein